jgi:aminoglycoside phosphotransferase family enzyme/predicted kinase
MPFADVTVAEQRERFGAWLQRQVPGEAVEWRETHVSLLALTKDRVWKCKKAVRFPFVDLSTVAMRRANCEREVALNRRLAPDVYVGAVPLDDAGVVVDHLVEMRRLPDDRRLAAVVGRGDGAGERCVDEIATVLARFHDHAATGAAVDRAATQAALSALWTSNVGEVRPFAGTLLDASQVDRVGEEASRYLAGRDALFRERIAGGRIRDGHGDLLADDVFCLDDGPRILDCLEFDDGLRFGDVLADVAFLAMELERLDRPVLARRLLDGYARKAGDAWPSSLAHLYVAYRALVRTKVSCLRASDDPESAPAAQALLALCERHLANGRVRIVLIGGPPATGKSTVARALGVATGWPVIRSDEVRKERAGIQPTTSAIAPVDRGLYEPSASRHIYAELLDRARLRLERGRSVILDASWPSGEARSAATAVADATASELDAFVCTVEPEVADARAAARARAGDDASDATPAIAAALRARFESWPDATALDTSRPVELVVERVLERLGPAATSP